MASRWQLAGGTAAAPVGIMVQRLPACAGAAPSTITAEARPIKATRAASTGLEEAAQTTACAGGCKLWWGGQIGEQCDLGRARRDSHLAALAGGGGTDGEGGGGGGGNHGAEEERG